MADSVFIIFIVALWGYILFAWWYNHRWRLNYQKKLDEQLAQGREWQEWNREQLTKSLVNQEHMVALLEDIRSAVQKDRS